MLPIAPRKTPRRGPSSSAGSVPRGAPGLRHVLPLGRSPRSRILAGSRGRVAKATRQLDAGETDGFQPVEPLLPLASGSGCCKASSAQAAGTLSHAPACAGAPRSILLPGREPGARHGRSGGRGASWQLVARLGGKRGRVPGAGGCYPGTGRSIPGRRESRQGAPEGLISNFPYQECPGEHRASSGEPGA